MKISIYYKEERLLTITDTEMEHLTKVMLFAAEQKSIDPKSNLMQLIINLRLNYGPRLELDLNTAEEVLELAEILRIAVKSLKQQGYFDSFTTIKNDTIINPALNRYLSFIIKLQKIGQ